MKLQVTIFPSYLTCVDMAQDGHQGSPSRPSVVEKHAEPLSRCGECPGHTEFLETQLRLITLLNLRNGLHPQKFNDSKPGMDSVLAIFSSQTDK